MRSKLLFPVAITLVAMLWPFVAVFLSAYQVIPGNTERWTSLLCLPLIVIGAMYLWNQALAKPMASCKMALAIILPLCATTALFQARRHSHPMFAFWMMKRVRAAEWQAIASSMDSIARRKASVGESTVLSAELPRGLSELGRAEQHRLLEITDFRDGRFGARLVFGDRNRKFGLLVGPDEFMGFFPKFRQSPVASNAQFFVGSDW